MFPSCVCIRFSFFFILEEEEEEEERAFFSVFLDGVFVEDGVILSILE